MSARELAAAYAAAKNPATRKELRAYCAKRAAESDRIRWKHLLAAIDAGDAKRIAYHAASGDAKREAAKALRPKADAKAKAPAKAAPKAPAMPEGVTPELMAAFVAFMQAQKAPAKAPAKRPAKSRAKA
jgi:hypothetical protein